MTGISALAELATAVCRIRRLRAECPRAHRPTARVAFHGLAAAKADVIELVDRGCEDEARAIVADWAHEAAQRVASVLAHAPLETSPPVRSPTGGSGEDRRAQTAPGASRPRPRRRHDGAAEL